MLHKETEIQLMGIFNKNVWIKHEAELFTQLKTRSMQYNTML